MKKIAGLFAVSLVALAVTGCNDKETKTADNNAPAAKGNDTV